MRHYYEGNDRYQFQPRYVKAYRWCRFVPACYVVATFRILWWIALGMKPWEEISRWQMLWTVYGVHRGSADIDMGHTRAMDELIRDLGLDDDSEADNA